ncbi:unnamed protein product [Lepidochelys kempii]
MLVGGRRDLENFGRRGRNVLYCNSCSWEPVNGASCSALIAEETDGCGCSGKRKALNLELSRPQPSGAWPREDRDPAREAGYQHAEYGKASRAGDCRAVQPRTPGQAEALAKADRPRQRRNVPRGED